MPAIATEEMGGCDESVQEEQETIQQAQMYAVTVKAPPLEVLRSVGILRKSGWVAHVSYLTQSAIKPDGAMERHQKIRKPALRVETCGAGFSGRAEETGRQTGAPAAWGGKNQGLGVRLHRTGKSPPSAAIYFREKNMKQTKKCL